MILEPLPDTVPVAVGGWRGSPGEVVNRKEVRRSRNLRSSCRVSQEHCRYHFVVRVEPTWEGPTLLGGDDVV